MTLCKHGKQQVECFACLEERMAKEIGQLTREREYSKKSMERFKLKNREYHIKYHREYYWKNRDKIIARQRERRKEKLEQESK